jgi:Lipid-droplet associated hydrolase
MAHLSLLVRHVPLCILRLFQPTWPINQLQVLRALLRAPAAIYAALTMAHDEMETVRELDVGFLRDFAENVSFYYAEEDDWVGEQRAVVLRALRGTPAEGRVVHGRGGIPHVFCISTAALTRFSLVDGLTPPTTDHSAEVASQCIEWMRTGGFLGDVRS